MIHLGGRNIWWVEYTRFLGVMLQAGLKQVMHVREMCNCTQCLCGLLQTDGTFMRVQHSKPQDTLQGSLLSHFLQGSWLCSIHQSEPQDEIAHSPVLLHPYQSHRSLWYYSEGGPPSSRRGLAHSCIWFLHWWSWVTFWRLRWWWHGHQQSPALQSHGDYRGCMELKVEEFSKWKNHLRIFPRNEKQI